MSKLNYNALLYQWTNKLSFNEINEDELNTLIKNNPLAFTPHLLLRKFNESIFEENSESFINYFNIDPFYLSTLLKIDFKNNIELPDSPLNCDFFASNKKDKINFLDLPIDTKLENTQPPELDLIPEEKFKTTSHQKPENEQISNFYEVQGLKVSNELPEIKQPEIEEKPIMSFLKWLAHFSNPIEPNNPITINDKTNIKLPEALNNEEKEQTEVTILTETMAEIFVEQGKISQALKIYFKLSLKYPEKNAYFANKIKELKNLNQ